MCFEIQLLDFKNRQNCLEFSSEVLLEAAPPGGLGCDVVKSSSTIFAVELSMSSFFVNKGKTESSPF